MKKLLPLGLIIAAVLSLGLMGCKQNADEEKLPGTWTSSAELWDFDPVEDFVTRTGNEFKYVLENPLTQWGSTVASGKFSWNWYTATKELIFTGFKATASANSGNSGCGFIFNWSKKVDPNDSEKNLYSYYALMIQYDSILIKQCVDNVSTTITDDWESASSIKLEPDVNKVDVYTDSDGSIIIRFNGDVVKTIRNPVLKSGRVGFIIACGDQDQAANKKITATYKFSEFQY